MYAYNTNISGLKMRNAKKKKKLPHSVVFWVVFFWGGVVLHDSPKLNDGCEQSPDFLTINAWWKMCQISMYSNSDSNTTKLKNSFFKPLTIYLPEIWAQLIINEKSDPQIVINSSWSSRIVLYLSQGFALRGCMLSSF